MNSVMTLALVVLFPVACLLTLLGLSWLEDSLERGIEADATLAEAAPAAAMPAKSPVVEMPVRRTGPAAEAPAPRRRLQPSRAAS